MKIAIIGAGPTGVELALKFHLEGAQISLFERSQVGANLLLCPEKKFNLNFKELISLNGLELIKKQVVQEFSNIPLDEKPTHQQYVDLYLLPLAKYLSTFHKVIQTEIVRVQKRYILKEESLKNSSRLGDLFRVVYKSDPKNSIATQMMENPKAFENLDASVIESLNQTMEAYEDFDLVIESLGKSKPRRCGNGTYCIGEKSLEGVKGLYYGNDIFSNFDDISSLKEIAIIGSGETAAKAIINFYKNYDGKKRIFLITTEESPFNNLAKENSELYFELEKALETERTHYKELSNNFIQKLKEWDELEDYVKVKVPRPAEPIPNYVVFSGHNISSLDRLIDKDKFFLTCEIPEFRNALVQKENGVIPLKTISTNAVLVATGYEKDQTLFDGLNLNRGSMLHDNEPGFYSTHQRELSGQEIELLSSNIFNNVLTFYKRA